MLKDIKELNFPEYATLTQATVTLQDMAEKTITSQVKIDGQITPDFSFDWEVEFKGEKYIMPLRQPQGEKSNTSLKSTIDLTFHHWAIYNLKRWYFFTVPPVESGLAIPDKYIASVSLNLSDFCTLFGQVLSYYFNDSITIDLNPEWKYQKEPTAVEISHSYIWDVLIKFHELFAVRWQIEPTGDIDHYVIKVGYPTTEIGHIFEYGFDGGLMKVERQVQDENIRNMIIGRGGEHNLPYRYFKKHDEDNASFSPDPDWIPELKDIFFSELHGATFRSYIQGWKAAHIEQYRSMYPDEEWSVTVDSAEKAYAPWAWMRGYTDEKFNPVEYVADEFTTDNNGYSINPDSSMARYGELMGGLENNEEIYPTIQGVVIDGLGRIDETVYVEPITSDDIEEAAQSDAQTRTVPGLKVFKELKSEERTEVTGYGQPFTIPEGKHGNYDEGAKTITLKSTKDVISGIFTAGLIKGPIEITIPEIDKGQIENATIILENTITGEQVAASGIPEGTYRPIIKFELHNTTKDKLNVTIECANPKLTTATLDENSWSNTWQIWVKNLWGTEKGVDEKGNRFNETDAQYASRVWNKILGDREGQEAKVVFSDGWLSTSEDYEFTIVTTPEYNTSKKIAIKDEDGNETGLYYPSHWKITLAKSDADLESTGLYLPSTRRQAESGDHFFFTGIDMPHLYVIEAEKRLDDWKKDELKKVKEIKPTWSVTLDKIRIHQKNYIDPKARYYFALEQTGLLTLSDGGRLLLEESGFVRLVDKLVCGNQFTLRDKRFISGSTTEKLYIQSVTFTYNEPTDTEAKLLPDVEIVLSDNYTSTASSVSTLQSDVSAIQRQLGSISNIEQIIRSLCDKLYLRKDGFPDRSMSPTEYASLLTSEGFRNGIIGGTGWGFFKDENGDWNLELDRLNLRKSISVNDFIINQVSCQSGTVVESAAQIEITMVRETGDGYACYFDQKEGSVANLFQTDDVAFCTRYTADNNLLKTYKRRVTAVSDNSITLSKVERNGNGEPEVGDIVIHYGSYKTYSRTFVKVRDVIGGGYERYIENLTDVNTDGDEYYFVGKQNGMYGGHPRWFVGDKESNIEYINRVLTLNNVTLSLNSKFGDKSFADIFSELDMEYIRKALQGSSTIIEGGLILSTCISLGVNDNTNQHTYSGISGIYDSLKPGGGIAVWFGGNMLDKADYYDWDEDTREWILKDGVDITGKRIAAGVDRMDGTGYRANGNLWWDSTGKIYADPMSFFVGENTVGNIMKLFLFHPGQNIEWRDVHSVEPQRVFSKLRIGTKDGNDYAELYYDKDNKALVVDGNIVSTKDIVALNSDDDIDISGAGNGIDLATLDRYLTENRYATQDWVRTQTGTVIEDYAKKIDIPTSVSQLKNDIGYITGSSLDSYVKVTGGSMTGVLTAPAYQSTNGISPKIGDVNNAISPNTYWYGLSFNNPDNLVALGGFYGIELFTNLTRVTLTRLGNVGINTTQPESTLDVNGDLTIRGGLKFASGNMGISSSDAFYFGSTNQEQTSPICAGGLMVSDYWDDLKKKPENGIFSKGDVRVESGTIYLGDSGAYIKYDSERNCLISNVTIISETEIIALA